MKHVLRLLACTILLAAPTLVAAQTRAPAPACNSFAECSARLAEAATANLTKSEAALDTALAKAQAAPARLDAILRQIHDAVAAQKPAEAQDLAWQGINLYAELAFGAPLYRLETESAGLMLKTLISTSALTPAAAAKRYGALVEKFNQYLALVQGEIGQKADAIVKAAGKRRT